VIFGATIGAFKYLSKFSLAQEDLCPDRLADLVMLRVTQHNWMICEKADSAVPFWIARSGVWKTKVL
jgi:hypothetical protein